MSPPFVAFVDISEHQGHVDFDLMAERGVRHIILRAGINGRLDKRLDEYTAGCRRSGIAIIAGYWFCNPKSGTNAELQGRLLAQACKDREIPQTMLDCEWYDAEGGPNPPLSPGEYSLWARRMSNAVLDVAGSRPIVYTSPTFWDSRVHGRGAGGDGTFGDHDLIVANFPGYRTSGDPLPRGVHPDDWATAATRYKPGGPSAPNGWFTWDAWQFSAGYNAQGPVYGCQSDDLDLNIAKAGAMKRWLGTSIPTQEDEVTDDDIRRIVTELSNPDGPLGALITRKTFDVVYGLINEPEVRAIMLDPKRPIAGKDWPPAEPAPT